MMKTSLIPWQEFLDALKRQKSGTFELWPFCWLFTNEGVIETDPKFVTAYSKFHIADFRAAESAGPESTL